MDDLARQLLETCRTKGLVLATAESCTGGLISAALTEISGSSDVFDRGFITYSYAAKMDMLNVTKTSLAKFGAVSEPVAAEMVRGAINASNATVAIAVTGVAGPGSSEAKPEGMVCFGFAGPFGESIETQQFGAIGRAVVRHATVQHALKRCCQLLS